MQADSLQLQVLARAHPLSRDESRVLCDDRLMIVCPVRLDGCDQVFRSNLG